MKFNLIYADPPYSFSNKRTGGSHKSGASQKYPTIDFHDLLELPIQSICENDAVLFQWATVPMLQEALDIMRAWGFHYKTSLFWNKFNRLGMGYWFRNQVEILLLGTKGKIPAFRSNRQNLIQDIVRGHSEKPECFRKLIEDVTDESFPKDVGRKKIELFARREIPGWFCIGNEIDGRDIKHTLELLANYDGDHISLFKMVYNR